jgi:DNA-directed RNA polymerase specialized sigma24 family protein
MVHWSDSGFVFEEVLGRRLPGIYAFALFVTGDRGDRAETLLIATVEQAFERHLGGEDASDALDRSFVTEAWRIPGPRATRPIQPLRPTTQDLRAITSLEPAALRQAALRVPVPARLAIWLVVVERRSYAEVTRILGVDRDTLSDLLAWRDAMIGLALAETRGSDGHASTAS